MGKIYGSTKRQIFQLLKLGLGGLLTIGDEYHITQAGSSTYSSIFFKSNFHLDLIAG